MAKFVNKNFFDENYFLYFEDIDLCRKVKNENGKIFQDFNIKITHFGAESVYTGSEFQLEKIETGIGCGQPFIIIGKILAICLL